MIKTSETKGDTLGDFYFAIDTFEDTVCIIYFNDTFDVVLIFNPIIRKKKYFMLEIKGRFPMLSSAFANSDLSTISRTN